MTDNNQDRSQDQGQQGSNRETEQRNRENEAGQADQGQQFTAEQREKLGEQAQGQSSDTALESDPQTGGQSATGQGSSDQGGGFVGSNQDNSSDYLTKGEENQDFAPEGRGAQESSAGSSDIETGQSQDSDSSRDDGSDSGR